MHKYTYIYYIYIYSLLVCVINPQKINLNKIYIYLKNLKTNKVHN